MTNARGQWVLVLGTDVQSPPTSLELTQFFPTVPFPNRPTPDDISCLAGDPSVCMGSFYGQAATGIPATPARTYGLQTTKLSGEGRASHLLTFHAGGNAYGVVACSGGAFLVFPPDCTLSGVGDILGALAGQASAYQLGPSVGTFKLPLAPFLVFP